MLADLIVVVAGAIAASGGRLLLALAFRAIGTKLPPKRQQSLQALGHVLGDRRGGLPASFALFATAPIPSAQMFEAAGDRDADHRHRRAGGDRPHRLAGGHRHGARLVGRPPRPPAPPPIPR